MCPYSCSDMLAVSPCDLHFLSLFGVASLSLSLSLSSPLPGGCDRYSIQAGGKRERGEGRWRRRKRSISIPHRWGRALKKTQKERKKTWGKRNVFRGGTFKGKNLFPCCESTRVLLSSFPLDLFTVFPLCFPFQVSASDLLCRQTREERVSSGRPTTWVSTGGGDRCLYFRGGKSLKFAGKSKVRKNGLGETRTKKLDVISSRPPTKNVLNFSFLLLKQSRGRERERKKNI